MKIALDKEAAKAMSVSNLKSAILKEGFYCTDVRNLMNESIELVFRKLTKPKEMITYCIEVRREIEEPCVIHHEFDHKPTREEVLHIIMDEDMGYDDKYGKFNYYPV